METKSLNVPWKNLDFKLDRVVLAGVMMLIALGLLDRPQVPESLVFMFHALMGIAPFLILSVVLAALSRSTSMDKQIARVFQGHATTTILAAGFFGGLSPFCSCGVVSLIAGFLRAGVPLAPVMAFWIASPLMDPEMFILVTAVLGSSFALAKTFFAILAAIFAGFMIHFLQNKGYFQNSLRVDQIKTSCCSSSCESDALKTEKVVWKFWHEAERMQSFWKECRDTGWFLLKWMSLAFLIESFMVAYVPAEEITSWLGGDQWWAIPLSLVAGIPAYLNGYAAIPLVSGLIEKGMLPGAAMAFMVAGGVTSIPAAMGVHALVRRDVFFSYLLFGFGAALLAGYGFEIWLSIF